MRVLLTGSGGFLGWHLLARAHVHGLHQWITVDRSNWHQLNSLVASCDSVVHLAGINRDAPEVVERGNIALAVQLAAAMEQREAPLRHVVFANSVQAGNGTAYGTGKAEAADVLRATAERVGAIFINVKLPNLYGEGGRPHYNSFVATFVKHAIHSERPALDDRSIELLHAQEAAQAVLDALAQIKSGTFLPPGQVTSVNTVWRCLEEFHKMYRVGEIPPLRDDLSMGLFNQLRTAMFPAHYPIFPPCHDDHRGRLFETLRSHDGPGQSFVSTTRPGRTRGDHVHLRKIERFVVISGHARIALRQLITDQTVDYTVTSDRPGIVDMPTLWAHNITNIGDGELVTAFWTNDLFDPLKPDTYPEPVARAGLVTSLC